MHCPSWDDAFVSSLNNVDIAANGWLLMYLLFLVAAILCIESIALSVCLSVYLSVRMYVCMFNVFPLIKLNQTEATVTKCGALDNLEVPW